MAGYKEALQEFYSGEVLGEALYSALFVLAAGDDERLKMATLLQLETETKAWLRPHLLAAGLSIAEETSDRDRGAAFAGYFGSLPWSERLGGLRALVLDQVVPRYRALAQEAQQRGAGGEEELCRYMIDHELAQVDFIERELAGEANPLAPLERLLRYPLAL
jgi:hypothetical protein